MTPVEILLIFLITLGFSGAVPFAKVSVQKMSVEAFTTVYIGGIVFTMGIEQLLLVSLKYSFVTFGTPIVTIIIAGVVAAVGYLSGYAGMKRIYAGISSTIFNLQGPLILVFGAVVTATYPGNMIIIGLAISLIGIVLIGGASKVRLTNFSFGIPFILVVLAPILWALEWVLFSRVSSRDPVFFTFFLYLTAFLVTSAFSTFRRTLFSGSRKVALFAFMGGSLAGLANASYGVFITNYGTALTGIVTIISIPASVLLVIAVLHEHYTRKEVLGLLAIGIGLGISLIL
ncbi:MAG: EamA family transporter [Thermoplasmata archaeon]